ncbi:MAG TPA: iron-containing redox enzyme family protein [Labilithrix sp.]|nr:iron-containing redox enzyme family protein [Labilithrix sp.]
MASRWTQILAGPIAADIRGSIASGERTLYALWLCQVAHLTRHTSAHQALVGTRIAEIDHRYARFCFEHALEEVGHENMALHDLRQMGLQAASIEALPAPLPETERLTAYLYYVAERGHPAARLGYSYWAEKCYPFLQPLISGVKAKLGLSNTQMTFFVSHSTIDEKHGRDVERIVEHVCKTPEDWYSVRRAMADTLDLSVEIFSAVHAEAQKVAAGTSLYTEFLGCDTRSARPSAVFTRHDDRLPTGLTWESPESITGEDASRAATK